MISRYPSYCEKFRCIAEKCTDNCCIGWEIDIDAGTLAYYKGVPGSLGKRLNEGISNGCFVLDENERCPFLNSRGLCDIITELGEEHLCRICTEHPRYYEWFGRVREGGIGLCCEAAAELILSEDFALSEREIPDEEDEDCDAELFSFLVAARSEITAHLLNDSLPGALCAMLDFAEQLQLNIDRGSYIIPEFRQVTEAEAPDIQEIIRFFGTLEPIDDIWLPHIRKCAEITEKRLSSSHISTPILRRLAVYFIFRYFLKGVFDGEILSRVKLAALSVWAIDHFCQCSQHENGTLTFRNIVLTAKNYSKEVEYSEENLDKLAYAFLNDEIFSTPHLIGLIKGYQ